MGKVFECYTLANGKQCMLLSHLGDGRALIATIKGDEIQGCTNFDIVSSLNADAKRPLVNTGCEYKLVYMDDAKGVFNDVPRMTQPYINRNGDSDIPNVLFEVYSDSNGQKTWAIGKENNLTFTLYKSDTTLGQWIYWKKHHDVGPNAQTYLDDKKLERIQQGYQVTGGLQRAVFNASIRQLVLK